MRKILLTGGSRGIGRATALHLASEISDIVYITGRDSASLEKVANEAPAGNIRYYAIDFHRITESVSGLVELLESEGGIDIMINNAGYLVNRSFGLLAENEIREMTEVNFISPAMLLSRVIPLISRGGHIVNIASMGGFQGSSKFPGLSVYSSTKAAMVCLTECLAVELVGEGISVNCIAPGSVDTEMLQEAFPGYKAPVTADEMGRFIADFALNKGKLFNGKIIPVALSVP